MTYKDWLESYNGNHEQAGSDAWDIMRVYENANTTLKDERDALAAHFEQCRQVSRRIQGYSLPEAKRCLSMALDAIDKLPELTSARRDARMKAEALEEEAALGAYHTIHSRDEMTDHAAAYRRQAEEMSDG